MATFALGYAWSSEELDPQHLVRWGQRAEAAGFTFALISDHSHSWIDRQGQKTPGLFEHAAQCVGEEDVAESIICGPDVRRHAQHVQRFLDAGYDHACVHQVGPDQGRFFRFCEERVLPELR